MGTFQTGTRRSRSRMEKKGLSSTIVGSRVLQERGASENIRINRFHVSLVERAEEEEMEGGKKLDQRSHQQQQVTTSALHTVALHSGGKSHLSNCQVSAAPPCIRSLPAVQRRMVSWWDGYTPDTCDSCCCLNFSKADHSQGSAAESDMSSTSTVRAGSHLAKVLAVQVASWTGGPSSHSPRRTSPPTWIRRLQALTPDCGGKLKRTIQTHRGCFQYPWLASKLCKREQQPRRPKTADVTH